MNLTDLIDSMEGEQRKGALAVLDYLSRPMTAREIAARLRHNGVSQAKVAQAVAGLHVVALIGPGVD